MADESRAARAAAQLEAAGLTADEMAGVLLWLAGAAPRALTEALGMVDAERAITGSRARGGYVGAVRALFPAGRLPADRASYVPRPPGGGDPR